MGGRHDCTRSYRRYPRDSGRSANRCGLRWCRVPGAVQDQGFPSATWKRTKGRLSVHVSERAERLARVMAAAEYTWDDADRARIWMNAPHSELGGRTPLAAATTELGARTVE